MSAPPGCPKHQAAFDRACTDARCQAHWTPEGAPTPDEQLAMWADGKAVCPNTRHECTPDFGCCRPKLLWPDAARRKYVAASQGEREKMCMGAIETLVFNAGEKAYVTRGEPRDHE